MGYIEKAETPIMTRPHSKNSNSGRRRRFSRGSSGNNWRTHRTRGTKGINHTTARRRWRGQRRARRRPSIYVIPTEPLWPPRRLVYPIYRSSSDGSSNGYGDSEINDAWRYKSCMKPGDFRQPLFISSDCHFATGPTCCPSAVGRIIPGTCQRLGNGLSTGVLVCQRRN